MRGPGERYEFFAENAHVEVSGCRAVTLHRGIPFRYDATTDYAPAGTDTGSVTWEPANTLATLENKALFTQGFYFELKHFFDAVLAGEAPTLGTLESAREVMRAYEASVLSDGAPVALADL
jgi:predicted dehydrogenase